MIDWLRRAARVFHVIRPAPDDERASQAALLRDVKREARLMDREHRVALRAARNSLRDVASQESLRRIGGLHR
jgi:hypothetical protein